MGGLTQAELQALGVYDPGDPDAARRLELLEYLVSLGATAEPASQYTALVALFNGLFVFHYFVEMFIWKFSEPHYRQTLGPLYFAKK